MTHTDQYYMARALRLAEKGLWTTDPNPRVGCVLVLNGVIVGEGWHQVAGEAHAEVVALQMAGEKARGATCYVTLEPCCHHGKTPPCTDALIKAGVARVVAAVADPNPLVANKGIEQLTDAGIRVDIGVLSSEAEQLNAGFFMRMRHQRPYIRCKMAMSLDGRTAMASGESQWITSKESRADVQALRARSSAIMTGAGTVLADDPSLTVREHELPEHLPKPAILRQPLRVIIDTHLSMQPEAKMLSQAGQTLIYTASHSESLKQILTKAGATIVHIPTTLEHRGMDLHAVCQHLAQQHQVNELLLETGSNLSGAMLRLGLCDELIIYMAPLLMGNKARGLFELPDLDRLHQAMPLDIVEIRAIGCDWRITAHPIYSN